MLNLQWLFAGTKNDDGVFDKEESESHIYRCKQFFENIKKMQPATRLIEVIFVNSQHSICYWRSSVYIATAQSMEVGEDFIGACTILQNHLDENCYIFSVCIMFKN